MIQQRDDPGTRSTSSLGIFEHATLDVSNVTIDTGEWACIDFTVDSGAWDSVTPKKWPCEMMNIYPSVQSERGLQHEVASAQAFPCLGERRLEVWTEGASTPKAMTIQVADMHEPLLSLSRCADMGFELRFGKTYGALFDTVTGDITPLHRQGNLYMLRVWVRSAGSPGSRFGWQRSHMQMVSPHHTI